MASARAARDLASMIPDAPVDRWTVAGTVEAVNADGTLDVSVDGATLAGVGALTACRGVSSGDVVTVLRDGRGLVAAGVVASDWDDSDIKGPQGDPGGYYVPSVSPEGVLSWSPSDYDMPPVAPADVRGPQGDKGDPGKDGTIVDLPLSIKNGGTGRSTAPSMLVNLSSTSSVSPLGAFPRPGVTGTLPVSRGGTGATSASAARASLGAASASDLAALSEEVEVAFSSATLVNGYFSSGTIRWRLLGGALMLEVADLVLARTADSGTGVAFATGLPTDVSTRPFVISSWTGDPPPIRCFVSHGDIVFHYTDQRQPSEFQYYAGLCLEVT